MNQFLYLNIAIITCLWFFYGNSFYQYRQQSPVFLYTKHGKTQSLIEEMLIAFNVEYERTHYVDKNNQKNLYIIADDIENASLSNMPPYYIWYQTAPIRTTKNSNVLQNAVAVWEQEEPNINKYKNVLKHYCYIPKNQRYEYWDAAILSCFLPISALGHYKNILSYSNQKKTDISDHVPSLFCHCFLQNPQIIVEAGIRWGDGSTVPLYQVTSLLRAHMIGIDIENCYSVYKALERARFFKLDSTLFSSHFPSMGYQQDHVDFVFIDTTHQYHHTMNEIEGFISVLSSKGTLGFHDSNPVGNDPRGVIDALKDYFQLQFNELDYLNTIIERNCSTWHIIHYPYCNGMTIVKRIGTRS